MQKNWYILFWILALFSCKGVKTGPIEATAIFTNAVIFTAGESDSLATAMAIIGDKILAVGTEKDVMIHRGAETKVTDLHGAFVMPGLIEGHGHFHGLGESQLNINLLHTHSWREILQLTAEKVKNTPSGQWIMGRGWHQEKWTESPGLTVSGYPMHTELSAVSPDHPVILYHASGHSLFANAKAMQLAGISPETAAPSGGRIVRNDKGEPVGVFEENAMELIQKPYLAYQMQMPEDQRKALFDKAIAYAAESCLAKGITSFQDAGSDFWELEQYKRLAETGHLGMRLWAMISQPTRQDYGKLADFPWIDAGNGFLTVRAVKGYLDGALGSYGAWLLEPYADKPGFYGQNTTAIDTLEAVARQCKQYGLQMCVHGIGDRGNREVLNLYEKINGKDAKKADLRWRIEHAQHLDPADIPRFAQLGVVAAMQAIHCTSDAPFVVKRLGENRARAGAYAWRSLIDAGAHLANGTDTPVEDVDPFACIYAAVTRKRLDTGMEFFPEQCMSRSEALRSYTAWNAYAAFEEREKGVLAPGKLADFIVLDQDLTRCSVENIPKTKVLQIFIGGKNASVKNSQF